MYLDKIITDSPLVSFLLYHEIGIEPRPTSNLDCFCTYRLFKQQMLLLKKSKIHVGAAHEVCSQQIAGFPPENNTVVLTFDDADTSFLDFALPLLDELKFPSMVFAVAGQLGQLAGWVKDKRNAIPLMSCQQLSFLKAHQVEVGSHSMTHRKLTELTDADVIRELLESKAILEEVLSAPVLSLAYPHGCFDARIIELVAKAGYQYAYSTDGYRHFSGQGDRFCVPRKYITYHDNLESFANNLGISNFLSL